jgi:hypothetical protein
VSKSIEVRSERAVRTMLHNVHLNVCIFFLLL